jgi:hypothetical protein
MYGLSAMSMLGEWGVDKYHIVIPAVKTVLTMVKEYPRRRSSLCRLNDLQTPPAACKQAVVKSLDSISVARNGSVIFIAAASI